MDAPEPTFVEKVELLHRALADGAVRHAFGGALALAYYTHDPRATADVDLNISLTADRAAAVFSLLPPFVTWTDDDVARTAADEQIRLWWGRTPIDLFFRASVFHDGVAERTRWHPFASTSLPFLAADDLAVFKALFDRPKDWLDIAEMQAAGSIDPIAVADTVRSLVGDDQRVDRLIELNG